MQSDHAAPKESSRFIDSRTVVEVAVRGERWAMENISAEGVRIIGKVNNQSTGVKVFVGVRVGGLRDPAVAANAEPSE